MKKLKTNSKEVREAIKQHLIEISQNDNSFCSLLLITHQEAKKQ